MEKNITPDSVISALMNHAKTSDSDFPVHVFPAKMQRIILELNTTCGFPIDYTASAMLAAISVAIGNTHRVEVKRNWQESAIVYIANLNRRVLQFQENDTVNAPSDTVNVTANSNNDTVKGLKKSLQKVYTVILNNPKITHSEIMQTLHISESTAKRATRDLKKLGYIAREGSDKTGRWIIQK